MFATHASLAALLGTALLLAGCGGGLPDSPTPETAARPAREVVVAKVQREAWPDLVRVQGSFLGEDQARISTKVAGRIERVQVDLGSAVKAGDTLVVLDRRDLQLRIEQAEAMLASATSTLGLKADDDETVMDPRTAPQVVLEAALVEEADKALARARPLLANKVVTRSEYENLQAKLRTAQALYLQSLNEVREQQAQIGLRRVELAIARQHFDDAEVTAPFDAIVEQRQVSPGEYVDVGDPLITLVRIDRLRFTAGVPERRAHAIRRGQPIHIWLPNNPSPLVATITRVSPTVNQASRSIRIEADFLNLDFKVQSGLFAEADIVVDPESETIVLPQASVMEFAGVQKVWLVSEGEAHQRTVKLGRRDNERIEILKGLVPGDTIVANASEGVEGQVIAIDAVSSVGLHATSPGQHETVEAME